MIKFSLNLESISADICLIIKPIIRVTGFRSKNNASLLSKTKQVVNIESNRDMSNKSSVYLSDDLLI